MVDSCNHNAVHLALNGLSLSWCLRGRAHPEWVVRGAYSRRRGFYLKLGFIRLIVHLSSKLHRVAKLSVYREVITTCLQPLKPSETVMFSTRPKEYQGWPIRTHSWYRHTTRFVDC